MMHFSSISTKVFSPKLSSLHQMLEWAHSFLKTEKFSKKEIKRMEIALEEAFVNIIHYACTDRSCKIEICYANLGDGWVTFTLKDQGSPFDPTKKSSSFPNPESLEKQKEGGLGIPLMYRFVDEIDYRRDGEWNVLTLKKKFHH